MARAALGWSLDQLAAVSGVSRNTILRLEKGVSTPRAGNHDSIRDAFEAAGVRFLEEGRDAGGVVPPHLDTPLQTLSTSADE
jgi:transcriptional regulator with XRE-family HTH domain